MGPIITLTTDFGLADNYVSAMKGVISGINPEAKVVDISHLVPRGDITEGAFTMAGVCDYFPNRTIHVGVVDPGVGGERRAIVVETGRNLFVGPDNGLFTLALTDQKIVRTIHLTNTDYFLKKVSSTFHGRDIFAPVAARLSLGTDPGKLGDIIDGPLSLAMAEPHLGKGEIAGEIIHIDTFGNLITNITEDDIIRFSKGARLTVEISGNIIEGLSPSYDHASEGSLIAIFGSTGRLEISVSMGSASERLDARRQEPVKVSLNVKTAESG